MKVLIPYLLACAVWYSVFVIHAPAQGESELTWTYITDPALLPEQRVVQLGDSPWRVEITFEEPAAIQEVNHKAQRAENVHLEHTAGLGFKEGDSLVLDASRSKDSKDRVIMRKPTEFQPITSSSLHVPSGIVKITGKVEGKEQRGLYRAGAAGEPRLLLLVDDGELFPGWIESYFWLDDRHYVIHGGVRMTLEEEFERIQRLGILQDQGISPDATYFKERYIYIYDAVEEKGDLIKIEDPMLKKSGNWEIMTNDLWHRTVLDLDPPESLRWARMYLRMFKNNGDDPGAGTVGEHPAVPSESCN